MEKDVPQKRRSGLTRGQKGLIAAAAVLAVALAGVLAWQSLFVRPDLNTGKTEPQETEEPTDPVEEIDWGGGTRPRSDGGAEESGLLHSSDPGPGHGGAAAIRTRCCWPATT